MSRVKYPKRTFEQDWTEAQYAWLEAEVLRLNVSRAEVVRRCVELAMGGAAEEDMATVDTKYSPHAQ